MEHKMRNEKLNSNANKPLPSTKSSLDALATCLHKQKTKALGLSVMTCLLMGSVNGHAANALKKNQNEMHADLYIPSQAAMLTAAEKERLAKQSQTIQQLLEESKENSELIQELSEELQSLSYKLAHAKVDLFNFQENPEQKARIEALRQQIQEIRYSNKKLEDLVLEKQNVISNLESALEKTKALFNEKNEEVAYLSQIYEALQMRVVAEKMQTNLFAEGMHQIDQKQIELKNAHKALSEVDQELIARGKSLQEIQQDYQQLFDLYTLELADNQTSQRLLNEELQSLHEQHREKDIFITSLLSANELKETQFAQTLDEKSQQIAKLMQEKENFEDLIVSKTNAVEEYKAYELSLVEKYDEERLHAETMTKELFVSLAQVDKLQKDLETSDQLKVALKDAEDKIISLNQTLALQENGLKVLLEEHQNQIAIHEELKKSMASAENLHHSEKEIEVANLNTLLKDREETIRFFEQELEELAESHQALQEDYKIALSEQQHAQQKFDLNLQEMLAHQQDKEKVTLQLENDLNRLTTLLQEREQTLQVYENDLQELRLAHHSTQHEQNLILTAHEKTVLEQTALQEEKDHLTQLLKEREATVNLFEQDIAELTAKLQALQNEQQRSFATKEQDRSFIANLQQTQQELKDELAESLTQQNSVREEANAMQDELMRLAAQLQDREKTLQVFEKELEQLMITQQSTQQDQTLILTAREKAVQETAAFQQEQERLTALLKDREETIRYFERDIEELATKYQNLKSDYELVFADHQQDQAVIVNLQQIQQTLNEELASSLAAQNTKKDEALELQNELMQTVTQLQNREQKLQLLEKELELLALAQQSTQQEQELTQAALEKAAQEALALQQEREYLAFMLKDREETIRFFEQDIEELGDKYQALQNEYQMAFATQQQDQTLIADLQQTKEELKEELAKAVALQNKKKGETIELQGELASLLAQLQNQEYTLQVLENELEDLTLAQQTNTQDQELTLAAREKTAQEKASLAEEQERLAALLQEREETILFFEREMEELTLKYQSAQKEQLAASINQQQDQLTIADLQLALEALIEDLAKAVALQNEKKAETTELQDKLSHLTAQLQEREQTLLDFEEELNLLTINQQKSQHDQESTLAAREKMEQETAALQHAKEHLAALLQDREETIRFFEQDLEELATKYQNLQNERQTALSDQAKVEQDYAAIIASMEQSQLALKFELANAEEQQRERMGETLNLQSELARLMTRLEERDQSIHFYENAMEAMGEQQQNQQQLLASQEQRQKALVVQLEELLAQQNEQNIEAQNWHAERQQLAHLVKDREQTISLFEEEIEALAEKHGRLETEHHLTLANQMDFEEQLEKVVALQKSKEELAAQLQDEIKRLTNLLKEKEDKMENLEQNFLAMFSEKEAESLFLKQKIEKVEADYLTKESELADLMKEFKGSAQEEMASDAQ